MYSKNGRVKGMRITAKNLEFAFVAQLEDTPNPQILRFPSPPSGVTIEILGVYPGTEWDNTCLSLVWALEATQALNLR